MEFWYAKHQPSKRTSFLKDNSNIVEGPDGEQLKIYDDDDDDHAESLMMHNHQQDMARVVLEIECMLANSLVQ